MASMLLSVAGSALGSVFGPIGAMAGRAIGGLIGSQLDQSIFGGGQGKAVEGPRLKDLDVLTSTEGAPIPRLYGRMRLSGQMIWATKLIEEVSNRSSGGGGKSTSVSSTAASSQTAQTSYSYYANFAVGICEGRVASLTRVWADGKPLDLTNISYRFYKGEDSQSPDPLIIAKEGTAPAYRGLCYIVFERLPLENFGRRIPQLSFEIIKPAGLLEKQIRAVVVVPGSTEYGYEPQVLSRVKAFGETISENRHMFVAGSDFTASINELQALCPNLERVALVVAWFGTNLDCGSCQVKAGVEVLEKEVLGAPWHVSSATRATAHFISRHEGKSAYGGTPTDASVIHAIRNLQARGLKVALYPFIMMDIPLGNSLTNPLTGTTPQPAYPWRGQITSPPALDNTGAITTAISSFMGTAVASDFSNNGDEVNTTSSEWSYRRFIHHYAKLAQVAGGLDAFIIGSEMVGLSRLRSTSGIYPFVNEMILLAAEVKVVIPSTKLIYAADWSEYGAHVLDNAQEVRFPLDKLFASQDIAAVGIDFYAPLSDWRDGEHLDSEIAASIYDKSYLQSQIKGGEGYDYYYQSPAHRQSQTRTPISDGAYNKPWVFRQKDLRNWWANPHIERVNGLETLSTDWVPQSKQIWLTEFGVAAVDKATNQPSVFPDAKSSTASLPYFSNGQRDDAMMRAGLSAMLSFYEKPSENPISSLTGQKMLATDALYLWAWDARPYPAFPLATQVWSDGSNWQTGHWLNGRLGQLSLQDAILAIAADYEIPLVRAENIPHIIDGYALDRAMTARESLEPLTKVFQINPIEEGEEIVFRPNSLKNALIFNENECVEAGKNKPLVKIVRSQSNEIPSSMTLSYKQTLADYQVSAVTTRRVESPSRKTSKSELAIAASFEVMSGQAEKVLQDAWVSLQHYSFSLPPSKAALNVGDMLEFERENSNHRLQIVSIKDTEAREIEAVLVGAQRASVKPVIANFAFETPAGSAPAHVEIVEIPRLNGQSLDVLSYLAVTANPWKGGYVLSSSVSGASFTSIKSISVPSLIGEILTPLEPFTSFVWDYGKTIDVKLARGVLTSLPQEQIFAGENAIAIKNSNGFWEIIQFQNAELIADKTYRLSMLLRGQQGTDTNIAQIDAGASFVVIDEHITPLSTGIDTLNMPMLYRLTPFGRDISDPATLNFTHTASNLELKPLSPVHLKATRQANGIQLEWLRRTRQDGDSFETLDIPLGEASERYQVTIYDGSTPKNIFITTTQSAIYADEITDFGQYQSTLTFGVAQMSAVVGAGFETKITVSL